MGKNLSKAMEIVKRDESVLSPCARSPYFPLVVKGGSGARVIDIDHNSYLDFSAGAASLNTGMCHPRVVKAICDQAEELLCYTIGYMYEESAVELAEELARITPGDFPKSVAFGLSGSDAIDGAIKFARAFTGRTQIISFLTAYHGTTYGALSASAISLNMRRNLGPMLPGFHHFPYPECNRCPYNRTPDSCALECLGTLKRALSLYLPAEEIAAVIVEPIGGDAGLVVPPERFMKELYRLCREKGILFVSDEVQQGFGRTGRWFGIDHFDIAPDIVVMGKAIASGMPLSALVMRKEIGRSLQDPGHCLTLAANAVCCRAALATLDVIRDEKLIDNARSVGQFIQEELQDMRSRFRILGETRGLGLSIAQDIVTDGDERQPFREACAKICYRCWERGLILTFLGENVLRIQPPLILTREEAREGLDILERSIEDFLNGDIGDDALAFAKGWQ